MADRQDDQTVERLAIQSKGVENEGVKNIPAYRLGGRHPAVDGDGVRDQRKSKGYAGANRAWPRAVQRHVEATD